MTLLTDLNQSDWEAPVRQTAEINEAHDAIEDGHVIYFPKLIFQIENDERPLISEKVLHPKSKNISYTKKTDTLRGFDRVNNDHEKMKKLMARFAELSTQFISQYLPHYADHLEIGRTSFRPAEILGRKAPSYKKDDTRLHVDAFPSSPNQGKRILRLFSNIHTSKPREWATGESFDLVAKKFYPYISKQLPFSAALLKLLKITKSLRTPYDHIMLHIHDLMKKDMNYQHHVQKLKIDFAPQSSWIVYTDSVSHAAISGQHVLEQTFYLNPQAMKDESKSPLRILESMTQSKLT